MSETVLMTGQHYPLYAVIQFEDTKVDVIKTKWAFFNEDGQICATIFPDVVTKQELRSFLLDNSSTVDSSWYDIDGRPYSVMKTFFLIGEHKFFKIPILNLKSLFRIFYFCYQHCHTTFRGYICFRETFNLFLGPIVFLIN